MYPEVKAKVDAVMAFVRSSGYEVLREKEIPYGHQVTISDGTEAASVSLFSTGKILVQGKAGRLKAEIEELLGQAGMGAEHDPPIPYQHSPRMGLDESGKGDYFGPLVVAGVYVDGDTQEKLAAHGVRDSKTLSDSRVFELAQMIRGLCQYEMISLAPAEYNRVYLEYGNLNALLASIHARALETLVVRTSAQTAVVDRFAGEAVLSHAIARRGIRVNVVQVFRGERDIAVAAASILARAGFLEGIHALSQELGIELPRGSSDPRVAEVGWKIVRRHGQEGLARVAKMHFRITGTLIPD